MVYLEKKVTIIGAGTMGNALTERLLRSGIIKKTQITLADTNMEKLRRLQQIFGIRITPNNMQAVQKADVVILAVKPQHAAEVFQQIRPAVGRQLFLSIMAGVSLRSLVRGLGTQKVIRSMPNTPAQLGFGATVWKVNQTVTASERKLVRKILNTLGQSFEVKHEEDINRATAVSGSGPAYIFQFAWQLIQAAEKLGLKRSLAEKLVQQTLLGAAKLLCSSQKNPLELQTAVTSKGGTTEAALKVLSKRNLGDIWEQAVAAAYKRAEELTKKI